MGKQHRFIATREEQLRQKVIPRYNAALVHQTLEACMQPTCIDNILVMVEEWGLQLKSPRISVVLVRDWWTVDDYTRFEFFTHIVQKQPPSALSSKRPTHHSIFQLCFAQHLSHSPCHVS